MTLESAVQERMCSDEVEVKNGKSNPYGWSTAEFWHNGEKIGGHYCGKVTVDHPEYRFTVIDTPDGNQRLDFFCKINADGPVPM